MIVLEFWERFDSKLEGSYELKIMDRFFYEPFVGLRLVSDDSGMQKDHDEII